MARTAGVQSKTTSKSSVNSGKGLLWRADQLSQALEIGGAHLDPERVQHGRELIDKVSQRWALKGGRTVVSLAGATGSGKSSLFNLLAGDEVATVGARRPTTSTATAAIWGEEDPNALLDWLAVPSRYQVEPEVDRDEQVGESTSSAEAVDLDGLVLIDLPDFDSTEESHRVEADRMLERSDVFVWVTDPQKYADARLHEDYLATLRHHESVMLVVLNQVDHVSGAGAVDRIAADLRSLIVADGAGDFEVIATSARLGSGLHDLRAAIGEVVAARNAAEHRLTGDIKATSHALLADVADTEPELTKERTAVLNAALARAAGIPVVLRAVQQDYLRQSRAKAGWPFTRWVAGLRPSPLRRLRLGQDSPSGAISADDVRTVLGRSSLPAASPAARSAVDLATRQLGEVASAGLPPRWVDAVRDAATPDDASLADALDLAVVNTPLRTRDPWWWAVGRFLQLVFALCVIAGAGWLTTLAVLGWLQIDVGVPEWGPVPIPLLLFGGGILAGLLLAACARVLARAGSVRRRSTIEDRMDAAISGVAREHVRDPVAAVLKQHKQTRQQLQAATSP
ncbi:MAG: GTPase [Ornithinimicrobium sp.]